MREGPWRRRTQSRNSEREPAFLGRACQAKRLGDRMAERGSPGVRCGVAGPSRSKRSQMRFSGTPPAAGHEPGISASAKHRSTACKHRSFAGYHRTSHPRVPPPRHPRSHPRSHPISHLLSYPRHDARPTITLLVSPARLLHRLHRLQPLQLFQLLQLPCRPPRLAARRHRTMDEVHGLGTSSFCDPLLPSTDSRTRVAEDRPFPFRANATILLSRPQDRSVPPERLRRHRPDRLAALTRSSKATLPASVVDPILPRRGAWCIHSLPGPARLRSSSTTPQPVVDNSFTGSPAPADPHPGAEDRSSRYERTTQPAWIELTG